MKPQWEGLVSDLNALKEQWNALAPRLPEQINITQPPNSLPKEALAQAMFDTIALVEETSQRDDIDAVMLATHQNNLQNSVNALKQALTNSQNNPIPQHLTQIVSGIWSIRASLYWMLPASIEKWIVNSIKDASIAEQIAGLKDVTQSIYKAFADINTKSSDANKAAEELKKITELIKGLEREAGTAKTNAQSSASSAEANQKNIESTLKALTEGLNTYNKLSTDISELQKQVEATLEGASKVGLARSFSKRRQFLFWTQVFWAVAFVIGIIGLITVPTVIYEKFIGQLVKIDNTVMWSFLLRAALEAPIIWFTWFAVRQYGHTTRLVEDYAFKEATAMSFVGYRKEMGTDEAMLKLLQESAIKAFGSNPVRVLGKTDPSSPAHDLLEKVLDKGGIDKAISFANSLFSRK